MMFFQCLVLWATERASLAWGDLAKALGGRSSACSHWRFFLLMASTETPSLRAASRMLPRPLSASILSAKARAWVAMRALSLEMIMPTTRWMVRQMSGLRQGSLEVVEAAAGEADSSTALKSKPIRARGESAASRSSPGPWPETRELSSRGLVMPRAAALARSSGVRESNQVVKAEVYSRWCFWLRRR